LPFDFFHDLTADLNKDCKAKGGIGIVKAQVLYFQYLLQYFPNEASAKINDSRARFQQPNDPHTGTSLLVTTEGSTVSRPASESHHWQETSDETIGVFRIWRQTPRSKSKLRVQKPQLRVILQVLGSTRTLAPSMTRAVNGKTMRHPPRRIGTCRPLCPQPESPGLRTTLALLLRSIIPVPLALANSCK